MKTKSLIFITILLILIGTLSGDTIIKKDLYLKNGNYSNIILFGRNIRVNGNVDKFVIKIGGKIDIRSRVGRDVVTLFSNVKIGKNSEIKGDLIVIGGKLTREKGSIIRGEQHFVNFSLKKISSSLDFLSSEPGTINLIKIIVTILSLILALFVYTLIPNKITYAEEIFDENKLKTGLIGFIAIVISIVFFIMFTILSFIFIGIPLLILQLIFVIVMIVFGRIVMYYYIGKFFANFIKIHVYSPGIFILLGTFFYLLLYFIPVIGNIIVKILVIFEFGISIGYILRDRLKLKSLSDTIENFKFD